MVQENSESSPLLHNKSSNNNYDGNRDQTISVPTLDNDNNSIDSSKYAIFLGLFIAVILASLDSSIVATIYPQIGTEFKKSNQIVWIATSYMLSYTALQPLYGRISDVFGRKSTLLFATSVFFIGSFLCGSATNFWVLAIARAIAGLGGGGINCMTSVITSDLIPLRERGKFQSYGNIAYTVGSVLGAPLGGFINDSLGWRFCFYINLPLLALTIFIATKLLTNYNLNETMSSESFKDKMKKIDLIGAFVVVVAVICFLFATSLGGNIKPWSDPLVISCFIVSIIFGVLFCAIEAKIAVNPLMPWDIITSRTPFACSMTNFFCVMSTTSLVYITPLYFQVLLGLSPSISGLYVLPKIISVSIGSVFAGMYMSRTGEYRKLTIFMSLVAFSAMVGYSTWSRSTFKSFTWICLSADGLALGSILTTTLIAMHSCVKHSEMATITSISYLFRSLGGLIGISLTSAIFQGVVKHILFQNITGPNADLYIEIARKSMTHVRELLPPDVLEIVLDSYQTGLHYTYGSCAILCCFTFISTLFIQQFELNRK